MRLVHERWNPWRDLARLQHDVQQLARPLAAVAEYPPVNLYQTNTEIQLQAELPGVDPATFDIDVAGDSVTISGERPVWFPAEGQPATTRFHRTLPLPFTVDTQSATATYDRGVLTLKLCRPDSQQSRKVPVAAG